MENDNTNNVDTRAVPGYHKHDITQLEEAISECARELAIRRRCYNRWIQDGKLSTVDARDRLSRLTIAVEILEALADSERAKAGQQATFDEVAATVHEARNPAA